MTPEEQSAVKDAHTRLTQVPGYAGAVILLYTDHMKQCIESSTVPEANELAAFEALLAAKRPRSRLLLPN